MGGLGQRKGVLVSFILSTLFVLPWPVCCMCEVCCSTINFYFVSDTQFLFRSSVYYHVPNLVKMNYVKGNTDVTSVLQTIV